MVLSAVAPTLNVTVLSKSKLPLVNLIPVDVVSNVLSSKIIADVLSAILIKELSVACGEYSKVVFGLKIKLECCVM